MAHYLPKTMTREERIVAHYLRHSQTQEGRKAITKTPSCMNAPVSEVMAALESREIPVPPTCHGYSTKLNPNESVSERALRLYRGAIDRGARPRDAAKSARTTAGLSWEEIENILAAAGMPLPVAFDGRIAGTPAERAAKIYTRKIEGGSLPGRAMDAACKTLGMSAVEVKALLASVGIEHVCLPKHQPYPRKPKPNRNVPVKAPARPSPAFLASSMSPKASSTPRPTIQAPYRDVPVSMIDPAELMRSMQAGKQAKFVPVSEIFAVWQP